MLRVRFVATDDLPADHYEGMQQTLDGIRILLGLLFAPNPAKGGGVVGTLTNNGVVGPDSPATTTTVRVTGPTKGWAMLTPSTAGGEPFIKDDALTVVPITSVASLTAGQSRNDLIVARINTGQANTYTFESVIGTPAATGAQVDPALPTNSFVLARITRAFGAGAITAGQITDLRALLVV